MVSRNFLGFSVSLAIGLSAASAFWSELLPGANNLAASARSRHHSAANTAHSSHSSGHHHSTATASHHGTAHSSAHSHHLSGKQHKASAGKSKHVAVVHKDKHAYALDFFMMKAPDFDRTPFSEEMASKIQDAFSRGIADDADASKLVRAGVFHFHPLSGGIFNRREAVKYIVLHSTETGIPVPGKNVINGWNSMGRRHPGAQFVVDRDGTIYLAVDPDLGTVHVNIFKTLPGINNDNSIGIEMNHTGRQDYPAPQRAATIKLLTYLQHRFKVSSENVITHRYAQQGDHTDPVNFDLDNFLSTKEDFRTKALALKRSISPAPVDEETEDDAPLASVYVSIHGQITLPGLSLNNGAKQQASSALAAKQQASSALTAQQQASSALAAKQQASSALAAKQQASSALTAQQQASSTLAAQQQARPSLAAQPTVNEAASRTSSVVGTVAPLSSLEQPIPMPRGTFVAGGPLRPGSSPASEDKIGR